MRCRPEKMTGASVVMMMDKDACMYGILWGGAVISWSIYDVNPIRDWLSIGAERANNVYVHDNVPASVCVCTLLHNMMWTSYDAYFVSAR